MYKNLRMALQDEEEYRIKNKSYDLASQFTLQHEAIMEFVRAAIVLIHEPPGVSAEWLEDCLESQYEVACSTQNVSDDTEAFPPPLVTPPVFVIVCGDITKPYWPDFMDSFRNVIHCSHWHPDMAEKIVDQLYYAE